MIHGNKDKTSRFTIISFLVVFKLLFKQLYMLSCKSDPVWPFKEFDLDKKELQFIVNLKRYKLLIACFYFLKTDCVCVSTFDTFQTRKGSIIQCKNVNAPEISFSTKQGWVHLVIVLCFSASNFFLLHFLSMIRYLMLQSRWILSAVIGSCSE